MSEFDELVASPGGLIAGRFGADGRVAEHKTAGLYVENPALTGIAQWFCAAVTWRRWFRPGTCTTTVTFPAPAPAPTP